MQKLDTRRARRLLKWQLVWALGIGLAALFWGVVAAYSALGGGLLVVAANGLMAGLVFGPYRASHPERMLSRFYVAEIGKLALVVLCLVVLFIWVRPLNVPALLGAYLMVQILPTLLIRE